LGVDLNFDFLGLGVGVDFFLGVALGVALGVVLGVVLGVDFLDFLSAEATGATEDVTKLGGFSPP